MVINFMFISGHYLMMLAVVTFEIRSSLLLTIEIMLWRYYSTYASNNIKVKQYY